MDEENRVRTQDDGTLQLGIPLLNRRVAPRCTCGKSLMLVTLTQGLVVKKREVPLPNQNRGSLYQLLATHHVDTLVCGGISSDTRSWIQSMGISIIDNVACGADEVVEALNNGEMEPGYGFSRHAGEPNASATGSGNRSGRAGSGSLTTDEGVQVQITEVDCLACNNMVCLKGECCPIANTLPAELYDEKTRRMLESSMDVSLEDSRQLCRVAELVYYCLEMGYSKIGIAYCVDLTDPARVLADIMRRFFCVVPVCCKVGGLSEAELLHGGAATPLGSERRAVACNPAGQADVLNGRKTDLNVVVGLCMGADCVFTQASKVPVTTIFVKDKSLANNPIGAVYSEYYLNAISNAGEDGFQKERIEGRGASRETIGHNED